MHFENKYLQLRIVSFIFVTHHVTLKSLNAACISLERKQCFRYMYHSLFHTCRGIPHNIIIFGDTLINMKTENRYKKKSCTAQRSWKKILHIPKAKNNGTQCVHVWALLLFPKVKHTCISSPRPSQCSFPTLYFVLFTYTSKCLNLDCEPL